MAAAKVTKKPKNLSVSKLALVREKDTHKMKATWTVPKALTKSDSHQRVTDLRITWTIDVSNKTAKNDPKKVKKDKKETHTAASINLNDFEIGKTKYDRKSFYPFKGKPYLKSVTVTVTPYNGKGNAKSDSETKSFVAPDKPTLDDIEFDASTGKCSTKITAAEDAGYKEKYDTYYKAVATLVSGNTRTELKKDEGSFTEAEQPIEFDAGNYQGLSYSDYIQFTVTTYSRGYAGNSGDVTKSYYVSYPGQVEITDVDVPEKATQGKCTLNIKTNSTTTHPVDVVRLDYLADCEYATAAEIPSSESWTESNIVDNGDCTALSIPVEDILPRAGNHTWVRVTSWHGNEDVLYRYSAYKEVTKLYQSAPTATDDEIYILSTEAGADGESALVQLGWNKDGQDDSTGTELTWSTDASSWKSTEPPQQYQFTWSDGQLVDGQTTYHDSALITIKSLAKESKYYIKARRYLEGETQTTYSDYAEDICLTGVTPESIVATAPRYVPAGEPLQVRWAFSGYNIQKEWRITTTTGNEYALTADVAIASDKQYYTRSGAGTEESPYVYTVVTHPDVAYIATYYELVSTNGAIIERGDGSVGSAQISSKRLLDFATDNMLDYMVQVSTGGDFVISEPHKVTIVEPPELTLTAPQTLTAQPFAFSATVSAPSDLVVIIKSQGISGQMPQGRIVQADGDTVYSNQYAPVWVGTNAVMTLTADVTVNTDHTYYVLDSDGEVPVNGYFYSIVNNPIDAEIGTYYEMTDAVVDDTFTTTISVPEGLDFIDTGSYILSVVAIDRTTELKSPEAVAAFDVHWTHQAPNPEGSVTITPIDTTDEDGYHTMAAQIDLTPPAGSCVETTDTTVVEGKQYYEITGAGTEESPYVVTRVEPQAGDNPSSSGWYETGNDLYDIYRMDVENPSLIGRGFPLDHTVIDRYAPFGDSMDLNYRVAIRTPDGDVDFDDIEYEAQSENMRFDWAEDYLELPYGNSMGDSYKKDAIIRHHMDGTADGYWNTGVERKSALRSDIIKIMQPEDVKKARTLARYAGPVFVRLPDGSAYEADVQVTDLSKKNDAVVSAAFDANEIDITDEFTLPIPYEVPDEEE